jgi:hypothetical protein
MGKWTRQIIFANHNQNAVGDDGNVVQLTALIWQKILHSFFDANQLLEGWCGRVC